MSRKARKEKAERNKAFVEHLKKLKAMRKAWRRPLASSSPSTGPVTHSVVCSTCGVTTKVPFEPTQGKPVLCRPCFDKKLAAQRESKVG